MSIHLSHAVAAQVLTPAEATAIEGAVIDHGDGVTELRLYSLTADQVDALDEYLKWAKRAEECGR